MVLSASIDINPDHEESRTARGIHDRIRQLPVQLSSLRVALNNTIKALFDNTLKPEDWTDGACAKMFANSVTNQRSPVPERSKFPITASFTFVSKGLLVELGAQRALRSQSVHVNQPQIDISVPREMLPRSDWTSKCVCMCSSYTRVIRLLRQ